jgi:hypothetical protein
MQVIVLAPKPWERVFIVTVKVLTGIQRRRRWDRRAEEGHGSGDQAVPG